MKMLRKVIPALMAAGLLAGATATHAAPVSISISAASVTGGSGYQIDGGDKPEKGGSFLDVEFTGAFLTQFTKVGDSFTFDLVRVAFSETDEGDGSGKDKGNGKSKGKGNGKDKDKDNADTRDDETNNLGVIATFTFANPANTVVTMTGTGTATTGRVDDDGVDYVLAWNPVDIDFGIGGKFRLSLTTLSFSKAGEQTASATLEMLAASDTGIKAVPEPATLALVSLALAGAAVVRRRRSA